MEPTIKYESCEEIYTGVNVDSAGNHPGSSRRPMSAAASLTGVPNINLAGSPYEGNGMKRQYSAISTEGDRNGCAEISNSHYQSPDYQDHQQHVQAHYGSAYTSTLHQSNSLQSIQAGMVDAMPPKRYRRGESAVLFSPPFFELQNDYDTVMARGSISARCLSCGVVIRGNKNVSSNFIKHMKRAHPEINKIYENYKIIKQRAGFAPKLFTHTEGKPDMTQNPETVEEHPSFFDASAFLEHMNATDGGDEERNSETTDPTTPPNSTENSEMADNSKESQCRVPTSRPSCLSDSTDFDKQKGLQTATTGVELSQKTLELMSNMLDEKLKAFVTRSELQAVTKAFESRVDKRSEQDITTSTSNCSPRTETTDGATMNAQIDSLRQECQRLRLAVQQSRASKRQLQHELQAINKMLHQRKLLIRNVKVKDIEQPQTAVEELIHTRLELPDVRLTNVWIVTPAMNRQDSLRQTLLIELENSADVKKIFRKSSKLRDMGIFVEPEISQFARKRKEKLMVLRKELLRRKADLKIMVRNTTLVVCGKPFYWDEVEGLCHDNSTATVELDATAYLQTLTGLDLTEFLNVLKNYDVQMR